MSAINPLLRVLPGAPQRGLRVRWSIHSTCHVKPVLNEHRAQNSSSQTSYPQRCITEWTSFKVSQAEHLAQDRGKYRELVERSRHEQDLLIESTTLLTEYIRWTQ